MLIGLRKKYYYISMSVKFKSWLAVMINKITIFCCVISLKRLIASCVRKCLDAKHYPRYLFQPFNTISNVSFRRWTFLSKTSVMLKKIVYFIRTPIILMISSYFVLVTPSYTHYNVCIMTKHTVFGMRRMA